MADPVELSVRNSLAKVIAELETIKLRAMEVGDGFKVAGDGVSEGLKRNTKQAETFLDSLRGLGRRVADQLRGDFKSLVSLNALTDALRLSNQLRTSIDQTITLSNTVRKLGTTFGIAGNDFASFQARVAEGLGDLGMDADVAANALQGLSKTPVRGQGNLIAYSQTAGMLASVGGERGREGEIAKGMADVIQARGGNVNDPQQMSHLAESLRRVFVQTGATPTESLRAMQDIFATMPQDLRKAITDAGLANLAAAAQIGGPNATKFLEEYLGKSPIARMAFEAQGGKGVFTDKGIDVEKFGKFFRDITSRVGGDPRLAAQTLGLSEEAAEGFVRMGENLDKVKAAQERIATTTGSLNEEYRASMGLGESFRASINKMKGAVSGLTATLTQGATNILSHASQSTLGSAAVVGGAAISAAALSGLAARGLSGILGGPIGKAAGVAAGAARTEAAEGIFGQKVVPVYVTNVDEIGAGGGGVGTGGLLGGVGEGAAGAGAAGVGLLAPFLAIATSAAAAYYATSVLPQEEIAKGIEFSKTKSTNSKDFSEEMIVVLDRALKAGKIPEGRVEQTKGVIRDYVATHPEMKVKVEIDTKNPTLTHKVEKQSRGSSF